MKTCWTYAAALTLSFAASANAQTALPAKKTNAAFVQCALKEIRESGFSTHWTKANIRRGRIGFDDHFTIEEKPTLSDSAGRLFLRQIIVKGKITRINAAFSVYAHLPTLLEGNMPEKLLGYSFKVTQNYNNDPIPRVSDADYFDNKRKPVRILRFGDANTISHIQFSSVISRLASGVSMCADKFTP